MEREDIDTRQAAADPLTLMESWISQARESGVHDPVPMAFVTVGADGRPSSRMVGLKRIEDERLIFSSALWTRKARELSVNPHVSLLFYWPELGRQLQIAGTAEVGGRDLARQLFSERPLAHRLQSIVSRQGEPIDDLQVLRQRHAHLMSVLEREPDCPPDWGAISVVVEAIEFWEQASDRMHRRLFFERDGRGDWRHQLLSP